MNDFVVVGAGPAGSRFARRAADRGHDVLVFEEGEVGRPLACSGHVSTEVLDFVPSDAHEDLRQNEISGARFHLGGADSSAYRFHQDDPISNVIDRVSLDRELANAAREAGANVRENHTVIGVTELPEYVRVRVQGPEGPDTYRARMVVGCDGPASRVRRELDLQEPDEFLHGILGFTEEADAGDFVDVHLTVPGFFAWRIPRGAAGVEYGLAVDAENADAQTRFEEFIDEYGVDPVKRHSGLIPIGPPASLTGDRSLLIGDAAAQTKPFTGGGIRYGMIAADHAAREVDPTDPGTLDDYEQAWRDDLAREIRLGSLVRKGYSFPRPVQRAGLALFEGEIAVHMDRPTTLFSKAQLRALFPRSTSDE